METTVMEEVKPQTETSVEETQATVEAVDETPDRREEIDHLLRIKRERKIDAGRIPCPSCTVPVEITISRCPFCDSDIAAEAALARETTRRLRELSGDIDTEHAERTAEKPKRRGFFARLKYLFEGDPEPDPAQDTGKIDPHAKRLLSLLAPGDVLKVLEEDGAWLQVKTAAGAVGWVYSTVRKDP